MFCINKVGNNVNSNHICEFVADTVADIANLPHINTRGTQTGNDLINDKEVVVEKVKSFANNNKGYNVYD